MLQDIFCNASTNNARDKALLALFCETGCTLSEARQLKPENVKKDRIFFTDSIARDKKSRSVPISEKLCNMLKTKGKFIIESRGRQLSHRRIQQIVSKSTGLTPSKIRSMYISEHGDKNAGLGDYGRKKAISLHLLDQLVFDNTRDALIFRILRETGCRLSELVALKKAQCNSCIRFSDRKVIISRVLATMIKKIKGPFVISGNKPYSARRIQQLVSRYSGRVGTRVSPRIIRNSLAVELKALGKSNVEIANHLGCKVVNYFTHNV